jgi:competence protein ComEA
MVRVGPPAQSVPRRAGHAAGTHGTQPDEKDLAMHLFNLRTLKLAAHSLLLSLALAGSAFAAEKVNINTADAATIDRVLINVGPAKADAIVAYRKQNGAFRSPEQLAQVKGIGLKTIEKNRDRIVVGGAAGKGKPAVKAPVRKPVASR